VQLPVNCTFVTGILTLMRTRGLKRHFSYRELIFIEKISKEKNLLYMMSFHFLL
jgi:hypothetical protein